MNPCRSRPAAAWRTSPEQPSTFASPSKTFTAFWATTGSRSCNMGNASAHEAQWAAGAIRTAALRPRPPMRRGSVLITTRDVSQQCPHRSLHALVVLSRVVCRLRREQSSQEVVATWACQLDCKSGTHEMASHNFASSSNLVWMAP